MSKTIRQCAPVCCYKPIPLAELEDIIEQASHNPFLLAGQAVIVFYISSQGAINLTTTTITHVELESANGKPDTMLFLYASMPVNRENSYIQEQVILSTQSCYSSLAGQLMSDYPKGSDYFIYALPFTKIQPRVKPATNKGRSTIGGETDLCEPDDE